MDKIYILDLSFLTFLKKSFTKSLILGKILFPITKFNEFTNC